MSSNNDGFLNKPLPALPLNWVEDPIFSSFDPHDRLYAFQIIQNLDALRADKAQKLFKFIAESKGIRV